MCRSDLMFWLFFCGACVVPIIHIQFKLTKTRPKTRPKWNSKMIRLSLWLTCLGWKKRMNLTKTSKKLKEETDTKTRVRELKYKQAAIHHYVLYLTKNHMLILPLVRSADVLTVSGQRYLPSSGKLMSAEAGDCPTVPWRLTQVDTLLYTEIQHLSIKHKRKLQDKALCSVTVEKTIHGVYIIKLIYQYLSSLAEV